MTDTAVPAVVDPNVAPGSTVVIRDAEWLITNVSETSDGPLLHVQGMSELVRADTEPVIKSLRRSTRTL